LTLIVGIVCPDGVVVSSDGAATLGALGQRTARQPTRKLEICHNAVIVGTSGPIGLGQRIFGEIEELTQNNGLQNKKPFQAMNAIRIELFNKYIQPELQAAQVARGVVGQPALDSALSATLVAMPVKDRGCLFAFDQQGAPEMASDSLPFMSIGSGQPLADPFLAFIRRVFWPDRCPTIPESVFAVVWTLDHAIKTNPGGVADPVQVAILEKQDNNWRARELDEAELHEHREATSSAEDALRAFRQAMASSGGSPPETPPQPN
jgi:20S proteasome alpha/beta subunit